MGVQYEKKRGAWGSEKRGIRGSGGGGGENFHGGGGAPTPSNFLMENPQI